jgi:hypothetical protein
MVADIIFGSHRIPCRVSNATGLFSVSREIRFVFKNWKDGIALNGSIMDLCLTAVTAAPVCRKKKTAPAAGDFLREEL